MTFKLTTPGGHVRHVLNAKGEHVGTWKHYSHGWRLSHADGTPVRGKEGYWVTCDTLRYLAAQTALWVNKLTPAHAARMKEAQAKRDAARQLRANCSEHAEEIYAVLRATASPGAKAVALLKKLEAKR